MFKQMLENKIGEKMTSYGIIPTGKQPFHWVDKFRQSLDATSEKLQSQFYGKSSCDKNVIQPTKEANSHLTNVSNMEYQRKTSLKAETSFDEEFKKDAVYNDTNILSSLHEHPKTPQPFLKVSGNSNVGRSIKIKKMPCLVQQNSIQVLNNQEDKTSLSSLNEISNHSSLSLKQINQASNQDSNRF